MLLFILHSPTGFAPDAVGRKAGFVFVLFFLLYLPCCRSAFPLGMIGLHESNAPWMLSNWQI